MEKINEVNQPLVVGKFYLVLCISINVNCEGFKAGQKIPVIPNLHKDLEIDVEVEHYHYDRRFIKNPPNLKSIIAFSIYDSQLEILLSDISWEQKKCYRNETWFPSLFSDRLEKVYKSCQLENNVCPHRNTYLGNIAPDANGEVICPSHGLKWNVETGCLVARALV